MSTQALSAFNNAWDQFRSAERNPATRLPENVVIGREWCWDNHVVVDKEEQEQPFVRIHTYEDKPCQLNFDKPETIDFSIFRHQFQYPPKPNMPVQRPFSLESDAKKFMKRVGNLPFEEDVMLEHIHILIHRFNSKVEQIYNTKQLRINASYTYVLFMAFVLAIKSSDDHAIWDKNIFEAQEFQDLFRKGNVESRFKKMQQYFLIMIDHNLTFTFKDRWELKKREGTIKDLTFENYIYCVGVAKIKKYEKPKSKEDVEQLIEAYEFMERESCNTSTRVRCVGENRFDSEMKTKVLAQYQREYEEAKDRFMSCDGISDLISKKRLLQEEFNKKRALVLSTNEEIAKAKEKIERDEKALKIEVNSHEEASSAYQKRLKTDGKLAALIFNKTLYLDELNKFMCIAMARSWMFVQGLDLNVEMDGINERIDEIFEEVVGDRSKCIDQAFSALESSTEDYTRLMLKVESQSAELAAVQAEIEKIEKEYAQKVFENLEIYRLYAEMNYKKGRYLRAV